MPCAAWQVVESRARDAEVDDGGAVWVSALTLVDLAGSERLGKTGALTGPLPVLGCSLAVCPPQRRRMPP